VYIILAEFDCFELIIFIDVNLFGLVVFVLGIGRVLVQTLQTVQFTIFVDKLLSGLDASHLGVLVKHLDLDDILGLPEQFQFKNMVEIVWGDQLIVKFEFFEQFAFEVVFDDAIVV